jgi:pimeloyl-ACP methyl ester carboxylesterase
VSAPWAGEQTVAGCHLRRAGRSGPPLLCLHGIGGSADSFAEQARGLADRFQVYAWDAPGYARSPDRAPTARPLAIADYAAAAAGLLRALGLPAAHVLGVSWGGVIATELALRHPGLVRSLVLADSSRGSGRTRAGAAAMRGRIAELSELGPRAFAALRAPRLVSPRADARLVNTVTAAMAASIRLPGYADAAESMAATDHSADLGRLLQPTLVLVGAADTVTGVQESQAMAAALPRARLVVVPDAGHVANQERPAAVNKHVARFLTDVESELTVGQPSGDGGSAWISD